MPGRCCVPGCKSNYDSSMKNPQVQNGRGISVFKFPKNEERKQSWLKAVSRQNFSPTSSSVVCQQHFNSNDVITTDKHLQPDGTCKELLLSRPRLKKDAVPTIFPNLHSGLSESITKEKTDLQSRRKPIVKRKNTEVDMFSEACGDVYVDYLGIKQECDMDHVHCTEIKSDMDTKSFSINNVPTEVFTDTGLCYGILSETGSAECGTSSNNLSLNIKEEYDIGDFHSSGNDDIKCEIDIKNFSQDIVPTEVVMDTDGLTCGSSAYLESSECGTSINNLLPLGIKQESDMGDFYNGEIKCEMDVVRPEVVMNSELCYDFSADIANYSDYKFNIDTSHSSNIEETSDQACACDQTQELTVKCGLSDFKLTNKDTLIVCDDGACTDATDAQYNQCDFDLTKKANFEQYKTIFKCNFCEYCSSIKDRLQKHIDEVHINPKKIKDESDSEDETNDVTNVQCNLDAMKKAISKKLKVMSQCNFCPYSSLKKSNVQAHINEVHLKLKKFKCHLCDHRSGQKAHLQHHIETVHLKLKKFECHLCGYTSAYKQSLKEHIESVHLDLKKFKCNLCEYSSAYKNNLQLHIDGVHDKLRNFKCHLCDYSSWKKHDVKQHIDGVHLKVKKFKCDLCDYRAWKKPDMKQHIDAVHLKIKKFKCHLCELSMARKGNLRQHINRIHKKLKEFKCHLCEYSTAYKAYLQNHIDGIHLKLKKIKCHLCEYRTTEESNLQKHIGRIHFKVIQNQAPST